MNTQITHLAQQLGQALQMRQAKVATAESCTGGGIAEAITRIAGSSAWFDCGFVTYSNAAKSQLLSVPTALIDQYGAVSEAVVLAMSKGALAKAAANFSVAVSGIAGPDGGTVEKPVGTVWLAWAGPRQHYARCFTFGGDRAQVRSQAVVQALSEMLICVETTV